MKFGRLVCQRHALCLASNMSEQMAPSRPSDRTANLDGGAHVNNESQCLNARYKFDMCAMFHMPSCPNVKHETHELKHILS